MNNKKTEPEKPKAKPPHAPVKPKQPNTEGAPSDHDPKAQYEDKDES